MSYHPAIRMCMCMRIHISHSPAKRGKVCAHSGKGMRTFGERYAHIRGKVCAPPRGNPNKIRGRKGLTPPKPFKAFKAFKDRVAAYSRRLPVFGAYKSENARQGGNALRRARKALEALRAVAGYSVACRAEAALDSLLEATGRATGYRPTYGRYCEPPLFSAAHYAAGAHSEGETGKLAKKFTAPPTLLHGGASYVPRLQGERVAEALVGSPTANGGTAQRAERRETTEEGNENRGALFFSRSAPCGYAVETRHFAHRAVGATLGGEPTGGGEGTERGPTGSRPDRRSRARLIANNMCDFSLKATGEGVNND